MKEKILGSCITTKNQENFTPTVCNYLKYVEQKEVTEKDFIDEVTDGPMPQDFWNYRKNSPSSSEHTDSSNMVSELGKEHPKALDTIDEDSDTEQVNEDFDLSKMSLGKSMGRPRKSPKVSQFFDYSGKASRRLKITKGKDTKARKNRDHLKTKNSHDKRGKIDFAQPLVHK